MAIIGYTGESMKARGQMILLFQSDRVASLISPNWFSAQNHQQLIHQNSRDF